MRTPQLVHHCDARCPQHAPHTTTPSRTSLLRRFRQGVRAFTGLIVLLGTGLPTQATHYAGGQITYTNVAGSNVYTVRETIYRDCAGIPLGTTASISISNNVNTTTIPLTLNVSTVADITPLCPGQLSRCASSSGAFGIQEHIYTGSVTLNPLPNNGSYTIGSVGNCCRNNAISTLSNPGAEEMFLFTTLNPNLSPRNNSPVFLNRPIAFLCANQPATLSPNAFDPDGDALQYSLSPCYDLNVNDPVTYAPGFSATNPISSSTGISININTGEIAFTPTTVNQVAVICIKASEFRNGVKIGEIVRDIQVRVLNCNNAPPVVAPITSVVVPVGTQFCTSVSATDANINSITLTATSGIIPPATFTSTSSGPGFANGQFCWTPTAIYAGNTYTVSINAIDNGCPVVASGSETFNITVPIPCNVSANASSTSAACGVNNGTATASMVGGTFPYQYIWSGPAGFSSSAQSLTGLVPGTYSVIIIDGNGCTANASTTVIASGSSISGTATSTGASCGQNNGSITVNTTGGTAPYTYTYPGAAPQASNVFGGLATGSYTILITDANGCTGSVTANVGNALDQTPPVISCPANISIGTAAPLCGAPVSFSATATDNCGQATVSLFSGGASGSVFPVGVSTVSFNAVDNAGNLASCAFTITVTDDDAPNALCQNTSIALSNGAASISPEDLDAGSNDNCGIATISANLTTFGCGNVGNNAVVLTVTDVNGLSSTCSATVTVSDPEAPIAVCSNTTVQLDGNGNASINAEDIDGGSYDLCGLQSLNVNPNAFTCANVGPNTVTLTVVDVNGNSSSCTATVTVVDDIDPTAICNPLNAYLDAAGFVRVEPLDLVTASFDNCGIDTATGNCTFFCTEIGDNIRTITVIDVNGNIATCDATVTVFDTLAPNAVCMDLTLTLDGNGQATMLTSDIDGGSGDNCVISLVASQTDFDCAHIGVQIVTLTVTDQSGNASTCDANVTVEDLQTPSISCPANISVSNDAGVCGASVSYTPTATDNCNANVVLSIASGSLFAIGTTPVSAVATDPSGNASTCSFTVTVSDNEAPAAICQNLSLTLNAKGFASFAAADINNGSSDNCGISSITASQTLFDCTETGPNSVTQTVTDIYGNSSTCIATVTVIDNAAPVLSCPSNISVNNDAGVCGAVVAYNPTAIDNCSASVAVSVASGSLFAIGTTTVSVVATDPSNNSSTCSFTVTVSDNEAPVAICQNLSLALNAAGQASTTAADINNGSTDNCGIASISASPTSFTCAHVGANTVILTVTDIYGNSSNCAATVTVMDNTAPSAICQDLTINIPASGSVSVIASQIDNGSSDNCTIQSLGLSQTSFACADLGSNAVTLTVTDVNGNVSTCTAVVTVTNAPLVLNLIPQVYQCGYNITCNGAANGVIMSSTAGGCLPYSYAWSNGNTSGNATGLTAGTYSLTVTDANGNTASSSITLTQADPLTLALSSPTFVGGWNISCFGAQDGAIALAPAGGSNCQGYAYSWSGPGGFTSSASNLSGLSAGTYNVSIMDANGCTASASITLTQPTRVTAEAGNNVLVYWGYTQQYNCTTLSGSYSGGTPGYTRTWSTASGVIASGNTATVCPTTSTTYYFTVVDANGCTARDSVRVCVLDLSCTDRTNNGVGGTGQSGNGVNNGQGGGQGLTHIAICHIPPGNPSRAQTKCIPVGAIPNMLAQGSYLGGCGVAANYVCNFGSNSRMANPAGDAKSDLQVQAFPNPTTGQLSVQLSCTECGNAGKFNIKVVNLVGQELKTSSIAMANGQGMTEFDLSGYAHGFYFIVVENGVERVVEKIMKN
jgi:hypothetical protein